MNNQNKTNNISRTTNDIRKKLELSFMQSNEEPEISKAVDTKKQLSGKHETKSKEMVKGSTNTHISTVLNKSTETGNRYKQVTPRSLGAIKAKATFCLDTIALEQLNAVYIKRLSTQQKSDRSSLICEAISLLFEQEK